MKKYLIMITMIGLLSSSLYAADCPAFLSILHGQNSYADLLHFPRKPHEFIQWWKKLGFIKNSDGVAVRQPFTVQENALLSKHLINTMKQITESKKDLFAAGSWPHIEQHLEHADLFAHHLQSMGVDPHYYKLLATAHDMGKFVPDAEVLKLANGNFLMGRVAWHDQSTVSSLLNIGNELQIDSSKIKHLIADIIGHNDGSGLQDVFWTSVYPDYELPRRLEGDLLALFDRFGQGDWVGAMKIAKQQFPTTGWGPALIEEAYLKNPTNTMRQLEKIYLRASSRLKMRRIDVSPEAQKNLDEIYQYALEAQSKTVKGYQKLQWNEQEKSFALISHGKIVVAHNFDEFLSEPFQTALKN